MTDIMFIFATEILNFNIKDGFKSKLDMLPTSADLFLYLLLCAAYFQWSIATPWLTSDDGICVNRTNAFLTILKGLLAFLLTQSI